MAFSGFTNQLIAQDDLIFASSKPSVTKKKIDRDHSIPLDISAPMMYYFDYRMDRTSDPIACNLRSLDKGVISGMKGDRELFKTTYALPEGFTLHFSATDEYLTQCTMDKYNRVHQLGIFDTDKNPLFIYFWENSSQPMEINAGRAKITQTAVNNLERTHQLDIEINSKSVDYNPRNWTEVQLGDELYRLYVYTSRALKDKHTETYELKGYSLRGVLVHESVVR